MGNKRQRPKHLPAKLLSIRKHLGLSQIKMVMRLRTDSSLAYHRISEFESGRREPDMLVLLAYARAAGIPLENIVDDAVSLFGENEQGSVSFR